MFPYYIVTITISLIFGLFATQCETLTPPLFNSCSNFIASSPAKKLIFLAGEASYCNHRRAFGLSTIQLSLRNVCPWPTGLHLEAYVSPTDIIQTSHTVSLSEFNRKLFYSSVLLGLEPLDSRICWHLCISLFTLQFFKSRINHLPSTFLTYPR